MTRTREQLNDVASHWEAVANHAADMAQWNRLQGIDRSAPGQSSGDHLAETCRRTAKAIRLEADTGQPHCSICFGAHPNHMHMHQG